MPDWDSIQYLKFKEERTQPAIDLAGRITLSSPKKILDIGCGPGNSTQVLASRYPDAYILGIDSSENMIETAKKEHDALDFKVCDAGNSLASLSNDFDVIFSNACIQWIPNHRALLPNMMALLKDGGILAVQTPMNYEEPIHKIIQEITASSKWSSYFPNPRIFYNLNQEEYFNLLTGISAEFTMWQTTYFHIMKSHRDILEWYRATGLRPYLNLLPQEKQNSFEQEVLEQIIRSYPVQESGKIIFRFPRFFFTAVMGPRTN